MATITGTAGTDTLTGTGGNDILLGLDGNDTLTGGGGADSLIGGNGDDRLYVDAADLLIDGGAGYDTVYVRGSAGVTLDMAAASVERVFGGAGGDVITAAGAAQGVSIVGGNGDDVLTGSDFADYLSGGLGNDTLVGGAGDDTLVGGGGADTLIGGDGNDRLTVDEADTVILGGAGWDTVVVRTSLGFSIAMAASGVEVVNGGSGGDWIDGSGSAQGVTITGGAGYDGLIGSDFADTLNGGTGWDYLQGGAGNDTLNGGDGGGDTLYGGDGNDRLYVDAGDQLFGGAGYDTLYIRGTLGFALSMSDSGVEVVYGGDGVDSIYAYDMTESATIAGGAGNDSIDGSNYGDVLRGDAGNDIIYGFGGDDRISGGDGNDTLVGGDGADRLDGGVGDDTLAGGAGADTLIGGNGVDTADFGYTSGGVNITLRHVVQADGSRLTGIENLVGNGGNDVLEGDDGDNVIDGSGGNDLLIGGGGNDRLVAGGGTSTLIGGDGVDTADLNRLWGGSVVASLRTGTVTSWSLSAQMDGIENIIGSDGNDTLEGDANDNVLTGWIENDLLIGGDGVDTAAFSRNYDHYLIAQTPDGWTVTDIFLTWFGDGTDTLDGIEQIQFADRMIFIDGRNNAPIVSGPQRIEAAELSGVVSVDLLAGISDFEGDPLSVTDVQQTAGVGASFGWSGTSLSLDVSQFGDLAPGTGLTLTFQSSVTDGDLSTHQDIVIEVRGLSFSFLSAMADGGVGSAPLDVTIDTRQPMDALIGGAGDDPLSGGSLLLSGLGTNSMANALLGGGSMIAA